MGKNKLRKFSEMENFKNVIQPETYHLTDDISLKGTWNTNFFKNENPIVLELGCGKGEYSVSLAERYPEKNFIGIDIKGNRMWKGATDSIKMGLENIAFLRIRIENIEKCFLVHVFRALFWFTGRILTSPTGLASHKMQDLETMSVCVCVSHSKNITHIPSSSTPGSVDSLKQ